MVLVAVAGVLAGCGGSTSRATGQDAGVPADGARAPQDAAADVVPPPFDGGHEAAAADSGTTDATVFEDAGHDGAISDGRLADASGPDDALRDAPIIVNPDAPAGDAAAGDGPSTDGAAPDAAGDAAAGDTDGAGVRDGGSGDGHDGASSGVLTGGPCLSGAPGATAIRIQWRDGGGTAYVSFEIEGLPDTSQDAAGAYGYQIGFTPAYVDPFLAQGGLQLDGSDFVDIHLSTVGLTSITTATLSIYGRSYSVDTSGSFTWQTFDGTGQAAADLVSNVAPYAWYSADMTTEIAPGEGNALVRIKAGPSSGSLVVNRIEICMLAS
jgi:hypothetical protein